MKTIKTFLLIGVAALLATVTVQPVRAQSNFVQTVQNYFTSFNPAFGWTNVTIEGDTGYKQVIGEPAANTVEAQYDFQTGKLARVNFGEEIEFDGVGSALNSFEASGGYAVFEHLDTKVDLDLRVGYSFKDREAIIEPLISFKKKGTENTFYGTEISLPYEFGKPFNAHPTFYVIAGFTF